MIYMTFLIKIIIPKEIFTGPIMLSRYNLWIDWREDWKLNISLDEPMLMLDCNERYYRYCI